MVSRADLGAYVNTNRDIRALSEGALRAALGKLGANATWADLVGLVSRDVLAIVETYGDLAAEAAASLYDEGRREVRLASPYRARLAGPPDMAALRRVLLGELDAYRLAGSEIDAESAFSSLRNATDRAILGQGRRTIALNVGKDPARPRWAKVPAGKTCAWCLMIASRGPVFVSQASASKSFHGHCDCSAVAVWPGGPLPEGYDPEELRATYEASANRVGHRADAKEILSDMREHYGLK